MSKKVNNANQTNGGELNNFNYVFVMAMLSVLFGAITFLNAYFVSVVGLVLGIVGLVKTVKLPKGTQYSVLIIIINIIGIIVNVVATLYSLLMLSIYLAF